MAAATSTPAAVSKAAIDGDDKMVDVKVEKAATKASTPSNSAKKRKAPQKNDDTDDDEEDDDSPKKARGTSKSGTPASGKRKANKNPNKAIPMGRTYEQCAEHDKKLIDMRDAGKSWTDIRKEWTKLTGEKTAQSTLPNRYSRLKSNFVVIKEEDNPFLIEAKQEVEAGFEREKWNLISKAMEEKGTEKYRPDALKSQYKKLMIFAKELQTEEKAPAVKATPAKATRRSSKAVDYDEDGDEDMSEDEE